MVYDSRNAPLRPQRRDTPSRAARMPSGASLKGEVVVKIVTDSVASIPAEVVRARDIEVVSLFVNRDVVSTARPTWMSMRSTRISPT